MAPDASSPQHGSRTRDCFDERRAEGKTDREIRRWLKR
jgi:hypothetical protein